VTGVGIFHFVASILRTTFAQLRKKGVHLMALNAFGIISENKGQSIYAFGSHQFAIYFWARSMKEGSITVLHS